VVGGLNREVDEGNGADNMKRRGMSVDELHDIETALAFVGAIGTASLVAIIPVLAVIRIVGVLT